MSSNAYAYTLQTVPYEISVAEQRAAQLMMWRSTNKISPKTWAIVGAVTALAILGLIFLKNYSTIFCWVVLVCVALFLFIRLVAYEWYVKRKMNEFPVQEVTGIKLGIQPHGMVMQQKMGAQQGVANIAWKDISEWYDSPEFLLMTFTVKGQQGSFFLPKRMDGKSFPFATIRKHLNEAIGNAKPL
jgi:hypothetical protein